MKKKLKVFFFIVWRDMCLRDKIQSCLVKLTVYVSEYKILTITSYWAQNIKLVRSKWVLTLIFLIIIIYRVYSINVTLPFETLKSYRIIKLLFPNISHKLWCTPFLFWIFRISDLEVTPTQNQIIILPKTCLRFNFCWLTSECNWKFQI